MDHRVSKALEAVRKQVDASRLVVSEATQGCDHAIVAVSETARAHGASGEIRGGRMVVNALDRHRDGLETYLGQIQRGSQAQQEATTETVGLLENVQEVTSGMSQVTRASRRLALNATISSTRMGQRGRSLAMVAVQFKELAEQVREASERISTTASALADLLPRLSENSERLMSECSSGAARLDAHHSELTQVAQRVHVVLERLGDAEDAHQLRVIEAAEQAREAMQFEHAFNAGLDEIEELTTEAASFSVGEENAA